MGKVDRRFQGILLIAVSLLFVGIYSLSALESHNIEGYLICIAPDDNGNIKIEAEFTECAGNIALVNLENEIYTISGTQNYIDKLNDAPKRRMGVLMDQNVTGTLHGHKRALHMMAGSSKYIDEGKTEKIKGTIYCLFPDYKKSYMNYKLTNKPCYSARPHAHFLHTEDNEIIAITGSEEHIKHVESATERKDVYLTGSISGSKYSRYINLK
ncbi:MAG: hypothetical protein GWO07_04775 [Candidatus Dadabacteria bacterium]|nr:hypothetical protein [Candidatus Dadabacteria bacterium]NIV41176.1 hypothetical protein [Candidatus Dadabacteria bacterium]NIX14465.1 hypothetical protein [Candidatus Dadabacteria bacterium]